jgi:hypothetical protein
MVLQVNRLTRHDCGDGMLIDQLRVAIAAQQHAEIIKPSYNSLEFNAIDQKDRQRRFGLPDMIEKCVLQIGRVFFRHFYWTLFLVVDFVGGRGLILRQL